ncbi:MAG: twin-arginine translocation signal domain-containing protein [Planctomycetaceae bacterium]|nr:twin-arginine translocation signal domain-containing protein [Planctomycetaceae bacterium]
MKSIKTTSRRHFLQTATVVGLGSFFAPAVLADKSNVSLKHCVGVLADLTPFMDEN